MIKITADLQGVAQAAGAIAAQGELLRLAGMQELFLAANEARTRMVTRLSTGARTGRIYKRRGVYHQASAPGEAPKTDRGGLVSSVGIPEEIENGYGIRVGNWYGKFLEDERARPWIAVSGEEATADLDSRIAARFQRFRGL